ncbi:MAG: hypothetical protein EOP50_03655 [Sphingobacteriales bacterium]|nr:MAG: hypothetical protein EOP50_03655 [Sphingobacteriales bacterium]
MLSTNERPAYNSSTATAGFNAPAIPAAATTSDSRSRRFDPAAERGGMSYPIPAFFEYRVDAGSREFQ